MSTSRQSPDTAAAGSVYEWVDPADSDRSAFSAVIRIELNDVASTTRNAAESDDPATKVLTPVEIAITPDIPSNGPDDSVSDNQTQMSQICQTTGT